MRITMLTTTDNPFDPFDQYDEWEVWDAAHQYHTPSLIARLDRTSTEESEFDQHRGLALTMNEIVDAKYYGPYKTVERELDDG